MYSPVIGSAASMTSEMRAATAARSPRRSCRRRRPLGHDLQLAPLVPRPSGAGARSRSPAASATGSSSSSSFRSSAVFPRIAKPWPLVKKKAVGPEPAPPAHHPALPAMLEDLAGDQSLVGALSRDVALVALCLYFFFTPPRFAPPPRPAPAPSGPPRRWSRPRLHVDGAPGVPLQAGVEEALGVGDRAPLAKVSLTTAL